MSSSKGFVAIGDYAGAANNAARIDLLLGLIPDPDASSSTGSGSSAGTGNTYLDEMSPGAAIQLRVELAALKANLA